MFHVHQSTSPLNSSFSHTLKSRHLGLALSMCSFVNPGSFPPFSRICCISRSHAFRFLLSSMTNNTDPHCKNAPYAACKSACEFRASSCGQPVSLESTNPCARECAYLSCMCVVSWAESSVNISALPPTLIFPALQAWLVP